MSQAKVEQYKKDKANRKKIMAKERRQRRFAAVIGWVVVLAVVVWAGKSAYNIYDSSRPEKSYVIDTDAVEDYLDTLD
jgi:ABC-type phosphate/phosphonate transport system permease subunit